MRPLGEHTWGPPTDSTGGPSTGSDCNSMYLSSKPTVIMPRPRQNEARCLSVCLSICRVLPTNSRTDKPKIGRMEAHHTGNPWTYLEIKRSNVKLPGRLMLSPKVCRIFWTGMPMKSKLGTQMKHEDLYHRQAPRPPRSKVKVARSHGPSYRRWSVSREGKVSETPKLAGRLSAPRAITRTSFKVKKIKVTTRLMLRPKLYHIYRTWRPTNFILSRQMEHALSTATASYKRLVMLGYYMRTGAYRVGRTR